NVGEYIGFVNIKLVNANTSMIKAWSSANREAGHRLTFALYGQCRGSYALSCCVFGEQKGSGPQDSKLSITCIELNCLDLIFANENHDHGLVAVWGSDW